jgi:hypothetical protein
VFVLSTSTKVAGRNTHVLHQEGEQTKVGEIRIADAAELTGHHDAQWRRGVVTGARTGLEWITGRVW